MLKYKNNLTLSKGGLDNGLKVGILAEIGYMLQECALGACFQHKNFKQFIWMNIEHLSLHRNWIISYDLFCFK